MLLLFLSFDILLVLLHLAFGSHLGFFHLDKEQNLAATYSGLKLLTSGYAATALVYFFMHEKEKRRMIILLTLLAGLFLYLGLDEMMTIHERVGFVLNNWFGVRATARASFRWIFYFSPLIILGFATLVAFLVVLYRDHRKQWKTALFGIFFFAGSLLFEYIGGRMLGRGYDQYFLIAEELSQMFGETFFLVVFIDQLLKIVPRSADQT